jgi:LuxR family transcriptional regulator, maltose regulon positive regulatory protein
VAVGLLASARWLAGNVAGAELLFNEAIEAAAAADAHVPRARWLSHRAVLLMDLGDWDRAAADVDCAMEVVDTVGLSEYGAVALAYAARARLHAHRGEPGGARAALDNAMRLRTLATWAMPWYAALVRLEMADVHLALGDPGPVTVLVRELDEILHHRPEIGLADRVERLRAQVRYVREHAVTTLSAAELRLLPYLQTHLSLQEIADRLYVSRNTVSSEVGSIYRKLGVGGRSEAVAVARRIGLLAPTTLA